MSAKTAKKRKVPYQVFVSHATADKWLAVAICEKIEETGASTFRDDRDIDGGDDIPERIRTEIKKSREFVVLLTPESVNRPWVLLEVGAAWGWRKSTRITAILCHVSTDQIPGMIQSKKAINLNECTELMGRRSEAEWSGTTMVSANPAYDVFVSNTHEDREVALRVVQTLRSYDLSVFSHIDIDSGESVEDAVWEAMAESRAFVAIISQHEINPSMAFEIGAASAWNKPMYGLITDASVVRTPIADLTVYPLSRLDEVALAIKRSSAFPSEDEARVLIEEYSKSPGSIDELALQPHRLSELTRNFRTRTKRQVAGEDLLRTLLRLRKVGALREVQKRGK